MSEKLSERMLDMLDMNMTLSERSWINRITRYADEVAHLEAALAKWEDIGPDVSDAADYWEAKYNEAKAQVEALKDKLGNAESRIVKLEGNLQNIRDIAKLASATSSIIKICDALLEGKDSISK